MKPLLRSFLSLVLPEQADSASGTDAVAGELAEVVELENPTGLEHLEPLLGETLMAVGEVLDVADRAIGEAQLDGHSIARASVHRDERRVGNRSARQMAKQVDEVTALADHAPAADVAILDPAVERNGTGVDCVIERLGRIDRVD